jgi:hypothetical protein
LGGGGDKQKDFDEMKINIIQTPILTVPNLENPFEVEMDASGYAMGAILMQVGRPICYHSKIFHGVVINYPTYDKELYALVQMSRSGSII